MARENGPIEGSQSSIEDISKKPSLDVRLSTNNTLDELLKFITSEPMQWDTLIEYLRRSGLTLDQVSSLKSSRGDLAEAYIDMMLRQFSAQGNDVIIHPIKTGDATENFRFDYEYGIISHLVAKWDNPDPGSVYAEYDGLVDAEGLPVVFEVKTTLRKTSASRSSGFNPSIKPPRINQLFAPIIELFPNTKNFGYVVLCMPEIINPTSDLQGKFAELGGILRPLPTGYKEYGVQLESVVGQLLADQIVFK